MESAAVSVRRLAPHLRPHRRVLAVALSAGLAASAAGLAQPIAAREVLTGLETGAGAGDALLWLGALVVVGAGFGTLQYFLLDRTSERVVRGARRSLVRRLVRVRMATFDRLETGDLVARLTSDASLLGTASTTALVNLAGGAVTLAATLLCMALVSPVLLAVTVGVLAVIAAIIALVLPRILRATLAQQEAVGALGAVLDRLFSALRTVRASGAEPRELARAETQIEDGYVAGVRAARYQAVVNTATGLSVNVAFLVVLGSGGAMVAAGTLTTPDLIAFLLYLFFLIGPIAELGSGATALQGGLAALARIEEANGLPVEPDTARAGIAAARAPVLAPAAQFTDVRFSYAADGPPVLRGVSFIVPRTGLTAIVGPSGAGKTTLFALLERFYEPTEGAITLSGQPLGTWPLDALRAQLGYVEQDAPVLSGTLRDNLLLGAPDASDADLEQVIAAARLGPLVAQLPGGLDAPIGSRGATLSGGERQRIAIARALLRRPTLLLLDEATSQLDAENESALRDAIDTAARDRAVIAIAHRLSTVIGAAQIIVLDGGRVRASGTHAELLASDELYAGLVAMQFSGAEAN